MDHETKNETASLNSVFPCRKKTVGTKVHALRAFALIFRRDKFPCRRKQTNFKISGQKTDSLSFSLALKRQLCTRRATPAKSCRNPVIFLACTWRHVHWMVFELFFYYVTVQVKNEIFLLAIPALNKSTVWQDQLGWYETQQLWRGNYNRCKHFAFKRL